METSKRAPEAALLAIGTEITDGQITDRNSGWIARQLLDLGVKIQQTRAVPDERERIRSALEDYRATADLIFVTGGLGPTSDDFTREIVADVFGRRLEFDEESWRQVNDKLSQRGVPVSESQRQQCWYPAGSRILFNSAGTANGFMFIDGARPVIVLPGPPGEIAAIWDEGGAELLDSCLPPREPEEMLLWRCLGKGESEIADLTESILRGTGLRLGYRAHAPYVEVKVWVPDRRRTEVIAQLAELERALFPWVVNRQGEDLGEDFIEAIASLREARVLDAATGGHFAERLNVLLRDPKRPLREWPLCVQTQWQAPASPQAWIESALYDVHRSGTQGPHLQAESEPALFVLVADESQGHWLVGLAIGSEVKIEKIRPFYNYSLMTERGRKFITEAALQFFLRHIHG